MVTCFSCIASSKALCTLAGARLISSARTRLAKIGPLRVVKPPDCGLKIFVPMTSAGRLFGGNCRGGDFVCVTGVQDFIVSWFWHKRTPYCATPQCFHG